MSDFEILVVIIGIFNLLISFSDIIIALLVLLSKRNDK